MHAKDLVLSLLSLGKGPGNTLRGRDAALLDARERKEYISRYCASVKGWEGCTLAQQIARRYENGRTDNDEEY